MELANKVAIHTLKRFAVMLLPLVNLRSAEPLVERPCWRGIVNLITHALALLTRFRPCSIDVCSLQVVPERCCIFKDFSLLKVILVNVPDKLFSLFLDLWRQLLVAEEIQGCNDSKPDLHKRHAHS